MSSTLTLVEVGAPLGYILGACLERLRRDLVAMILLFSIELSSINTAMIILPWPTCGQVLMGT